MCIAEYDGPAPATEQPIFGSEFHQLSQDLRNPLNSIRGFAELLLQTEKLSPAGTEYVEAILSGSEALTDAVVAYLERKEARDRTIVLAPVRKVFADAATTARHSIFKRARHWRSPYKLRSGER